MWDYYAHTPQGEEVLNYNRIHADMNMPRLFGNEVSKGKVSQREPRHDSQTSVGKWLGA